MTRKTSPLATALGPQSDRLYALLRIVSGTLMSFHGMQKVLGILSKHQPEVFSQIWFGGVIELVAGIAVAAGFFTRYAAFLLSGTMAVAYLQFHWKLDFGERFFPVINRGELALLYSFVYLYIASKGAGQWSVDARLSERAR